MIKYEVRTVNVDTKDGKNAFKKFNSLVDQDTELLKSFDNLDDARKFYDTISTSVRYMGGFYSHECKLLEQNEYDDEGEWVAGGDWWVYDFPNAKDND